MKTYDIESSEAFIEILHINPYKKGTLSDLSFAVKDIIDVSGFKTGCGNPFWKEYQSNALSNAVCVDQLLTEGAKCIGKTHTDEFAFSLLGENQYYGTPINPYAPERVPGGSSSGSASAVACGIVDFALGTDTGGSVRIPASNCGIWGFRPSHGRISVAGVHPFAPTFDTVGVLANTYGILSKVSHVLLAGESIKKNIESSFYMLEEAFQISDTAVRKTLMHELDLMMNRKNIEKISFSHIIGEEREINFENLFDYFCPIQWAEIWNTHGIIIQDIKIKLGDHTFKNFEITSQLNREEIQHAMMMREWFSKKINLFLGKNRILIIPTAPSIAPKKRSIDKDRRAGNYYPRTLGMTALSGLARLPQISIPFFTIDDLPIGLSLIASKDNDEFLLKIAKNFE